MLIASSQSFKYCKNPQNHNEWSYHPLKTEMDDGSFRKKGNCNALIPKSDPNYRSKYAKSYIWGRVVFTLPKQNKKYAP